MGTRVPNLTLHLGAQPGTGTVFRLLTWSAAKSMEFFSSNCSQKSRIADTLKQNLGANCIRLTGAFPISTGSPLDNLFGRAIGCAPSRWIWVIE